MIKKSDCTACEMNKECIAIYFGCYPLGNCCLFLERKIGRRYTWKQLVQINKGEIDEVQNMSKRDEEPKRN